MRRLAGHWSEMADALKKLQGPADQTMTAALSAIGGQTHAAMATYWQEISGGSASDLDGLIAVCENFAEQLEHGATDIEHAKLTIYISIGTMVAMAFIPFGQIADLAAVAAVRLAIRRVVQQLIGKIMTKGATFLVEREGMQLAARWGARLGTQAAMGSALGAGTDLAAQGIQVAEHHREGGIDWGRCVGRVRCRGGRGWRDDRRGNQPRRGKAPGPGGHGVQQAGWRRGPLGERDARQCRRQHRRPGRDLRGPSCRSRQCGGRGRRRPQPSPSLRGRTAHPDRVADGFDPRIHRPPRPFRCRARLRRR
nr:hypothetical protein [Nocardia terpenica]